MLFQGAELPFSRRYADEGLARFVAGSAQGGRRAKAHRDFGVSRTWFVFEEIDGCEIGITRGAIVTIGQRCLLGVALVLNVFAAGWWLYVSLQVVAHTGLHALASSGTLLWFCFAVAPITAIAALVSAPGEKAKLTRRLVGLLLRNSEVGA
jgi:hypothetical protein